MSNEKVFQMNFGKVYGLLLNKAVKKGRTQTEVDEIICWLTGYDTEALEEARLSPVCYGDFFRNAPAPNPNRTLIKGVVCGIRVEEIKDPLMREIRYLDKLIDELAKGKPMEKISWSMPTYWRGRNLIQFAAFKRHIGLYPGPEVVAEFSGRLTEYKASKGAIQFPYSKPLPVELIREIANRCGENNR